MRGIERKKAATAEGIIGEAGDKVYEFAFIGGSLKLRGADAAPLRPIALPVR
ncbi:hypothetical protein [Woodsholea maritima]|uniref:hypothetical protein n=1 Tax=Woodsholea maritima TaxID=240237 RepID=UPI00035CB684|nr:hypothetical protein [Woodsholea maritima]